MRQLTVDIYCGWSWRKDVIMNRVKSNVLVKRAIIKTLPLNASINSIKFWKNLIREIVTNKRNFNTLDIGL